VVWRKDELTGGKSPVVKQLSFWLELVGELVTELLGCSLCEMFLLEAGSRGRGHFGKPQDGEHPPLEGATKRRQWRCDCGP
jgi:hypothetical protein